MIARCLTVSMMLMAGTSAVCADLQPVDLTCEYLENPIGIDATQPRLSWVLESAERSQAQIAYRILVADSEERLAADDGDLWDTRKVASGETLNIVYAGKPLAAGRRVWWKVRVWDRSGRESAWSKPAFWEMGLLGPGDWKARWICDDRPLPSKEEEFYAETPAPLFRTEFAVNGKIRRARAYVSGLGYYEMCCNGRRVGDRVLDPGWTSYGKRLLYSTYDITDLLHEGANAVGLIVGNGWYNPLPMKMWGWLNLREHLTVGKPRAIAQIEIECEDGTHQTVATGPDWKVGDSPILRNSVYLGELYDARREQPGWDQPGFADRDWRPVAEPTEPVGRPRAQMQPPIRVTRVIKPVHWHESAVGTRIYDMGRNFAGVVRLRVKGKAGTRINLRYGELLHEDGTLNGKTAVAGQVKAKGVGGPGAPEVAWQIDSYILKGQGEEEFTPRFTFHGFRYVEITGLDEETEIVSIEGLRMNADVRPAGCFSCSNEMFNQIQTLCEHTLLSNLFSVQSDCPQREKYGYGGDIVAASEFAMLNFDMAAFYAKVVNDFADDARDNGAFTETAPFVGIADEGLAKGAAPIGWGTVHPMLLWQLHQYYGNRRLLEEQYDTARRWVEFLRGGAEDHCIDTCIGDHESLVVKALPLTSTAFYYYNVHLLARMAAMIGRSDDARTYAALAKDIRDAFNRRFFKPDAGRYAPDTQADQAFPLYFGMAPPNQRDAILRALVGDVVDHYQGHPTTGIFGTKYMLNALSDLGRADVAFAIVNQKTFPGWGHMLERGATTLWEHWEFSDNVYSHNHPMFGSVSEWFFKAVAGIAVADDAFGANRLVFRPNPVGDLSWADGEYRSVRGRVACKWRIADDAFVLEAAVPVGASATLYLPAQDRSRVREQDRPADEARGVRFLRAESDRLVYNLLSGQYRFTVQDYRKGRTAP